MYAARLIALAGVLAVVVVPTVVTLPPRVAIAETQGPTKQQIETAIKAAHPTISQLRRLRKLGPSIDNMTPPQLREALGQIFTPDQLAEIRHSLEAQGVSLAG